MGGGASKYGPGMGRWRGRALELARQNWQEQQEWWNEKYGDSLENTYTWADAMEMGWELAADEARYEAEHKYEHIRMNAAIQRERQLLDSHPQTLDTTSLGFMRTDDHSYAPEEYLTPGQELVGYRKSVRSFNQLTRDDNIRVFVKNVGRDSVTLEIFDQVRGTRYEEKIRGKKDLRMTKSFVPFLNYVSSVYIP